MGVIVWDGKTLAADRRAVQGGTIRIVNKLRRLRGHLVACDGDWDRAQEMFHWFEQGADPEKAPPFMRSNDDWVPMLVITPDKKVLKYERSPYPMDFTLTVDEHSCYAMGSGHAFAMGAAIYGATAIEAARLASVFCPSCSDLCDFLRLEEDQL